MAEKSTDRIEQIEARLARAVPGPWEWWDVTDSTGGSLARNDLGQPDMESVHDDVARGRREIGLSEGGVMEAQVLGFTSRGAKMPDAAEADLIANAPADLQFLIRQVRHLQAGLQRIRRAAGPDETWIPYLVDAYLEG